MSTLQHFTADVRNGKHDSLIIFDVAEAVHSRSALHLSEDWMEAGLLSTTSCLRGPEYRGKYGRRRLAV